MTEESGTSQNDSTPEPTPGPPKPWWKKKRWNLPIVGVALLMILSALGHSSDKSTSENVNLINQSGSNTTISITTTSTSTPIQTTTAAPTTTATPTTTTTQVRTTTTQAAASKTNTYTNVDGQTIEGPSSNTNGATGVCNDGTYTHATHHQGACSGHGGVDHWL